MFTGTVPDAWKCSFVIPIFKKGKRNLVSNYRPISITSSFLKVMEKIVKKQLMSFLVENSCISRNQFGFMHNRSTTSQLITFLNNLLINHSKKQCSDVLYVDFSKAFDSVQHAKLLSKLTSYGINGCLHQWLCSWLNSRTQIVRIGTSTSRQIPVSSGVCQGSSLGPALFLIYINDIVDIFGGSNTYLFADDLKVATSFSPNPTLSPPLADSLNALSAWISDWSLDVCCSKSAVIHFGRNNPKFSYTLNGNVLPSVSSIRDLGVTICDDFSFKVHINNIVKKASQKINLLFLILRSSNSSLWVKAYCTYVRSILEYACCVYSPTYRGDIELIERVQLRFVRKLHVRTNTAFISYKDSCTKLNLESLYHRRIINDICFLFKIYRKPSNVSINDLFQVFPSRTRGLSCKIKPLFSNSSNVHKHFYSNRVCALWNSLPPHVLNYSFDSFKKFLSSNIAIDYIL